MNTLYLLKGCYQSICWQFNMFLLRVRLFVLSTVYITYHAGPFVKVDPDGPEPVEQEWYEENRDLEDTQPE